VQRLLCIASFLLLLKITNLLVYHTYSLAIYNVRECCELLLTAREWRQGSAAHGR